MKKYQSRFGIVMAGKIESFDKTKTVTVAGEAITPTDSFWSRFSPQRMTIIPAPEPEEGEEKAEDLREYELDFSVGYYVLTESGHDRFVTEDEFKAFAPVSSS